MWGVNEHIKALLLFKAEFTYYEIGQIQQWVITDKLITITIIL